MNLQLFIRDKLIGSIPIDIEQAANPSYLAQKRKQLEDQCKEIIEQSDAKPVLLLESRSTTSIRKRRKQ